MSEHKPGKHEAVGTEEVHQGCAPDGEAPACSDSASGDSVPGKKKPVALIVLLVVLIAIALVAGGYFVLLKLDQAKTPSTGQTTPQASPALAANPVDFASLQEQNPDIYAWIEIPNTNVNYPVVQSTSDDEYYLTHNSDGDVSIDGAIFSQLSNNTDFGDPVTVLYGHNNLDDKMFSTLFLFDDDEFFANNSVMKIYTPGHILTYTICSAYRDSNRHIMNSFDFSNEAERLAYFEEVMSPRSMMSHVREGITLTADSKIVQLSTCMSDPLQTNYRYIVTGVLVGDTQTS